MTSDKSLSQRTLNEEEKGFKSRWSEARNKMKGLSRSGKSKKSKWSRNAKSKKAALSKRAKSGKAKIDQTVQKHKQSKGSSSKSAQFSESSKASNKKEKLAWLSFKGNENKDGSEEASDPSSKSVEQWFHRSAKGATMTKISPTYVCSTCCEINRKTDSHSESDHQSGEGILDPFTEKVFSERLHKPNSKDSGKNSDKSSESSKSFDSSESKPSRYSCKRKRKAKESTSDTTKKEKRAKSGKAKIDQSAQKSEESKVSSSKSAESSKSFEASKKKGKLAWLSFKRNKNEGGSKDASDASSKSVERLFTTTAKGATKTKTSPTYVCSTCCEINRKTDSHSESHHQSGEGIRDSFTEKGFSERLHKPNSDDSGTKTKESSDKSSKSSKSLTSSESKPSRFSCKRKRKAKESAIDTTKKEKRAKSGKAKIDQSAQKREESKVSSSKSAESSKSSEAANKKSKLAWLSFKRNKNKGGSKDAPSSSPKSIEEPRIGARGQSKERMSHTHVYDNKVKRKMDSNSESDDQPKKSVLDSVMGKIFPKRSEESSTNDSGTKTMDRKSKGSERHRKNSKSSAGKKSAIDRNEYAATAGKSRRTSPSSARTNSQRLEALEKAERDIEKDIMEIAEERRKIWQFWHNAHLVPLTQFLLTVPPLAWSYFALVVCLVVRVIFVCLILSMVLHSSDAPLVYLMCFLIIQIGCSFATIQVLAQGTKRMILVCASVDIAVIIVSVLLLMFFNSDKQGQPIVDVERVGAVTVAISFLEILLLLNYHHQQFRAPLMKKKDPPGLPPTYRSQRSQSGPRITGSASPTLRRSAAQDYPVRHHSHHGPHRHTHGHRHHHHRPASCPHGPYYARAIKNISEPNQKNPEVMMSLPPHYKAVRYSGAHSHHPHRYVMDARSGEVRNIGHVRL